MVSEFTCFKFKIKRQVSKTLTFSFSPLSTSRGNFNEKAPDLAHAIKRMLGLIEDDDRTFYKELAKVIEASNVILEASTTKVIRKPSGFDQLSQLCLAWAICEHLVEVIKAPTLFARYFNELTSLAHENAGQPSGMAYKNVLQAAIDYNSNVDTSLAFRSIKEVVVVFEERVLIREIFSPSPKLPFTLPKQETRSWKPTYSPQPSWKLYSSSRNTKEESPSLLDTSLKKLETELEETKKELKLLKDRESGIEVALDFLNAELHKNMSKIAKAGATKAAKKVAALKSSTNMANVVSSGVGWKKTTEKKVTKKKPIIPLLGDLFSKKKGKSNDSVSRSTLKRICRGLGISWWPFKNDKSDSVLKPNHTDVVIHASDRTATPVLGTSIEPSGPTNIYVPVNLTEHGNQSSTLVCHNEEQTNMPDGSAQPKTTIRKQYTKITSASNIVKNFPTKSTHKQNTENNTSATVNTK
ncbi:hypothetical protein Tco_0243416 [Tanacetum coccineum]